ncbi:hypothetical protein JAAARDRAFT_41037 [Jaapia argillacea MUCL 33604]|uniref:Uncharacterized protein n=1 Tax=Jaapia argillacea MUCL 33604 TaxID=933084 RepID=A0A067PCL8_9AGAM|nr:hypothetical protein JAAARDRAFT_41037 [Jaapia argillacea MUCL 33604]
MIRTAHLVLAALRLALGFRILIKFCFRALSMRTPPRLSKSALSPCLGRRPHVRSNATAKRRRQIRAYHLLDVPPRSLALGSRGLSTRYAAGCSVAAYLSCAFDPSFLKLYLLHQRLSKATVACSRHSQITKRQPILTESA